MPLVVHTQSRYLYINNITYPYIYNSEEEIYFMYWNKGAGPKPSLTIANEPLTV